LDGFPAVRLPSITQPGWKHFHTEKVKTASYQSALLGAGDYQARHPIPTSTIVQSPELVIDQLRQFLDRAIDSLLYMFGLVGHSDGILSLQPCLDDATFVSAAFVAVLVAEVDLHPGNLLGESLQCALYHGLRLLSHFFAAFNVVVGIDLNFHILILAGFALTRQRCDSGEEPETGNVCLAWPSFRCS